MQIEVSLMSSQGGLVVVGVGVIGAWVVVQSTESVVHSLTAVNTPT